MSPKKSKARATPRFDVVVVPQSRGTNFGEGIAASLLRWLSAGRMVLPASESVADTWVEVYCGPGESAHDLFVAGPWSGETPVFHEAVLRWGSKPAALDYGVATSEVRFFFEIRGAVLEHPHGSLLKRMSELLHARFEVFSRPHVALPPHREVPPGEEPKDRKPKRKEIGPGLAGTRVEEL